MVVFSYGMVMVIMTVTGMTEVFLMMAAVVMFGDNIGMQYE